MQMSNSHGRWVVGGAGVEWGVCGWWLLCTGQGNGVILIVMATGVNQRGVAFMLLKKF